VGVAEAKLLKQAHCSGVLGNGGAGDGLHGTMLTAAAAYVLLQRRSSNRSQVQT
jgi:hypothetical protein